MYALSTRQRTSHGVIGSIAPAVALAVAAIAAGIAVVAVAVAVFATIAPGVVAGCLVVTLVAASLAAAVDARSAYLPDELIAVAALPPVAVLLHEFAVGHGLAAGTSIALGVAIFAGPVFVLHMISPAAMGFGDVKLGAALGASLGLLDPRLGLVALCVGSAATTAAALLTRRSSIAFGPGLVFGWAAALVVFGSFMNGSLPWR